MKPNLLACALLVLLAVAIQLPAQQPPTALIWPSAPIGIQKSDGTNEQVDTTEEIPAPDGSVIKVNFHKEDEDLLPLIGQASTNEIEIKARAEKENPSAQVLLGFNRIESGVLKHDAESDQWVRSTGGTNVAEKATEAAQWFRKAADQGRADAENNLGACYANGFGVVKDEAEAAKWFLKAAEQGDADAQYSLGKAYEKGEGVEINLEEAMKWYRSAARQSHASALERVRQSAKNGDANAQCFIGQLYDFGLIGVEVESKDYPGVTKTEYPKKPNEAVKWYRSAAAQGNVTAQNNLGAHYVSGVGCAVDYVEAYKWFNLAAANGDTDFDSASFQRDELAKSMTPDQIAEAQELSREFKPRQESGSDNSASPDSPTASGTGFFITDDGYLITNNHVVKDATKVRLVTSAGTIDAKVVQVDAANDLALLKAVGRFSPLPIAASRSAHLGGTVATVGFPDPTLQGFAPKLAKGEIASLSGAADDPRYFQISLPVQPGNSGGALVDERGNVVGIVSAKLDASVALAASGALPENVNYAVKSSFLLGFLESVPDVSAKLKEPNTQDEKFEDVVKSAQQAAVLVLVY